MASTWHHVSRDYPTGRTVDQAQALGGRVMDLLLDHEAKTLDVRDPATGTSVDILTVDLEVHADDDTAAQVRFDDVMVGIFAREAAARIRWEEIAPGVFNGVPASAPSS